MRHHLAITGYLALVISLPAVLSAAADDATAPISASTTTPNATTASVAQATAKPAASDPKNVASAAAQDTSSSDDLVNWVTLGVGSTFVHGDHAEFQHEQNVKNGVFGGVDDFHWEQAIGKSAQLTVDGHALVGNHDYDFKFDLTDEKLGYVRAGYTEFRTWYDGNGGYFPPTGETISSYDNDFHIDRRSGWIELGLTLPDLPVFALRYEYDDREGIMDSTSWGDNGTTAVSTDVKIVPTFLSIDETRNIFQGSVEGKAGETNAGLTLRYEIDEVKDSTYINLDPLNAPGAAGDRFVTQVDAQKNDIFNAHGFQETFFDDHVVFSSGFSFVNTSTNIGGSRVYGAGYGADFSPVYAPTGSRNEGYLDLEGLGSSNDYVGNFNLMITPVKDLVIIPAIRLEYQGTNLSDSSLTTPSTTPPTVGTYAPYNANNWTAGVAESVEVRYNGLRDWSLYANAELAEDKGNDDWNQYTAPVVPLQNQDWNRLSQKYTIGANWYPLNDLNFGTQYYHEIHAYDYTNRLTNTPIAYPGYLQDQTFTTDDMNIRATWAALNNLSFVTRYDFQYATVDTTSDPVNLAGSAASGAAGQVESSNITNHIISENIIWTPFAQLDLDLGGSYVINRVDTPVAGSTGVNNIVLDGMNDYWTVDAGIGYEINEQTHLQIQYNYYRADDYQDNTGGVTPGASAAVLNTNIGFPYGANTEEQNVTATVTHQINKALTVSLKYGFYHYTDSSVGGQDDYNAHLVYASTQYRF